METVLDTLVVVVKADTSELCTALDKAKEDFGAVSEAAQETKGTMNEVAMSSDVVGDAVGDAFERAAGRIDRALVDFVRTGELNLMSFGQIVRNFLADTLEGILNGSGGIVGIGEDIFGGIFGGRSDGGILNLGRRAIGGPVGPERPFLVGENGPEVFIPSQAGRIEPVAAGSASQNFNITINVNNQSATPMGRESAGQIALQVRRAVERAGRDM